MDDVQQVGGDGVENPGDNHIVHARPCRIVGAGVVAEDVILQGKTAKDEDVAAPLGVVGSLKIEDDRDQVLDVLHGGSLIVQVSDGCCFR
jgi:hypothetical protein